MDCQTQTLLDQAEKDFGPLSKQTSSTTSFASSNAESTRATTPEYELAFDDYYTIFLSPDNNVSIKSLEAAFIHFEPFRIWSCAFCEEDSKRCSCRAWPTSENPVHSNRTDFLTYLDQQEEAAKTLQECSLSYLLALEESTPFGLAFNIDQRAKCNTMNRQLELVKRRIRDLSNASALLTEGNDTVPDGFRGACIFFESLLANCLGNVRENHVCLKLNYTLAKITPG